MEEEKLNDREAQVVQFKKTVKHLITRIIILFILSALGGFLFRVSKRLPNQKVVIKCIKL